MSAADSDEHFNPLLVTVLPQERRARHPYQLCAMVMLLTLGAWQLAIEPSPKSSVNLLDEQAFVLLNWFCVVAGAAGLLAAFIPERIVRWRIKLWRWVWRTDFDATYFRLWDELGCHLLLFTVWLSYGLTVWSGYGLIKGYSLGLASAVCFAAAAIWRTVQIVSTLWRAGTFRRPASAIVGNHELR